MEDVYYDFIQTEYEEGEQPNDVAMELLMIFEFIHYLRRMGYKAQLKATEVRYIIDTDAPFEEHSKIRDAIVLNYKVKYNIDVSKYADMVFGLLEDYNKLREYEKKLVGGKNGQ